MNKIMEALSKLLPAEQVKEVSTAVQEQLESSKGDIEKEFNSKLEEAYAEMTKEIKESETVAEQGYQEAFGIIQDLRNRLDTQRAEFESQLEEGYEEAYQMLLAEKGKNETFEKEVYEQYDKKLAEMKEYFVDKIDEFISQKGKEIYEQARRDVVNDPRMVEHKVAMSKIAETVRDYISDDDFALASNAQLEEVKKQTEELKGQVRILEARNIRLSTENTKLNESVRQSQELIKEHAETVKEDDKKERTEKAEKAVGRGKQVVENVEVIGEHKTTDNKSAETVVENSEEFAEMQTLAGLKK